MSRRTMPAARAPVTWTASLALCVAGLVTKDRRMREHARPRAVTVW